MVIGILKLNLLMRGNHCLKEKRRLVKSIIGRVKSKFNVSIAEVENQDVWQSAQIGLTIVGNDRRFVNSSLDKVVSFIEHYNSPEITSVEIEIINV